MNKQKLYHMGKSGAVYQWTIWTEGADIVTEYGQIDGKMQIARKTATPKNVGRSNATTAEEQAVLEAKSMHKNRLDRKYSKTIKQAEQGVYLPMLAASFDKRKNKVNYPVDVQPKLDGCRCMAYWEGDRVKLISRNGKEWENCDHIIRDLENCLPEGWTLDGELYVHGKSFQEITKLVKKWRPESEEVVFHVYDVPSTDVVRSAAFVWDERKENLNDLHGHLYEGKATSIEIVNSEIANDEEEVYEIQSEFLEQGYEGAIVREHDGEYRFGYRSNKLLKVKNFMDDEYEIIGYTTGVGKFEGCVVWICTTDGGKDIHGTEFKVVPQGTMEERKELYEQAEEHVGELLKVKYFELTDDNVPRFPVGIGFRLAQDI